jgi:hypothetical protein
MHHNSIAEVDPMLEQLIEEEEARLAAEAGSGDQQADSPETLCIPDSVSVLAIAEVDPMLAQLIEEEEARLAAEAGSGDQHSG